MLLWIKLKMKLKTQIFFFFCKFIWFIWSESLLCAVSFQPVIDYWSDHIPIFLLSALTSLLIDTAANREREREQWCTDTELLFPNWVPAHLKWKISHGLGKVVGFQAVPVVEMFSQKHWHLQRNCQEGGVTTRTHSLTLLLNCDSASEFWWARKKNCNSRYKLWVNYSKLQ